MRLQLLGVGSVPVLTVPLKDNDDSCINLSALARFLGMKRSTLFDHIQAKGLETAIKEAALKKRNKKLAT